MNSQTPSSEQITDWRSTRGTFAGDPIMSEIIEEGRKIREEDRRIAREGISS